MLNRYETDKNFYILSLFDSTFSWRWKTINEKAWIRFRHELTDVSPVNKLAEPLPKCDEKTTKTKRQTDRHTDTEWALTSTFLPVVFIWDLEESIDTALVTEQLAVRWVSISSRPQNEVTAEGVCEPMVDNSPWTLFGWASFCNSRQHAIQNVNLLEILKKIVKIISGIYLFLPPIPTLVFSVGPKGGGYDVICARKVLAFVVTSLSRDGRSTKRSRAAAKKKKTSVKEDCPAYNLS